SSLLRLDVGEQAVDLLGDHAMTLPAVAQPGDDGRDAVGQRQQVLADAAARHERGGTYLLHPHQRPALALEGELFAAGAVGFPDRPAGEIPACGGLGRAIPRPGDWPGWPTCATPGGGREIGTVGA